MFQSARLKLTAWYLLIAMIISLSFSTVIYRAITNEVTRFEKMHRERIERGIESGEPGFKMILRMQQDTLTDAPDSIGARPFRIPVSPELIKETQERILYILILINGIVFIASGGIGYFLAGRTLQPIKEMVDEQNRFITDASHELKTPLTSLKTAFEVYLRGKDKSVKESSILVEESLAEVNKLQTLSESLLQLAQYEKPNGHSHFKAVHVTQVIEEAVHKLQKIAAQKDVTIFKTLEDAEVNGHKESLVNLMVILLDNAIKYSKNGTAIQITSEKKDNSVVVSVTDEGIGIKESDQKHIFDRFYRADTSRSKVQTNGYGLGLSIAKKIVELHKGSLQVKSVEGEGSTFKVVLPGSSTT